MFLSGPQLYAQAHATQQKERLARERAYAEEKRGRSRLVSPAAIARARSEERYRQLWAEELQRRAAAAHGQPTSARYLLPSSPASRHPHSLSPPETPSCSPPTDYFSPQPSPLTKGKGKPHLIYDHPTPTYGDQDWELPSHAAVYPDQQLKAEAPSPPATRQTSQARALERTKARAQARKDAARAANLKQKEVIWDCQRNQALHRAHMLFLEEEDVRLTREENERQASILRAWDEGIRRAEEATARDAEILAAEIEEDERVQRLRLLNATASGFMPYSQPRFNDQIASNRSMSPVRVQSRAPLLSLAAAPAIPPRAKSIAPRKLFSVNVVNTAPCKSAHADPPPPSPDQPNPVHVPFKDVLSSMQGPLFPIDPSEEAHMLAMAELSSVESHISSSIHRSALRHSHSRGRSDLVMAEGYGHARGRRTQALSPIDHKDVAKPRPLRTAKAPEVARKAAKHKSALLAGLLARPSLKVLVEPRPSTRLPSSNSASSEGKDRECAACAVATAATPASTSKSAFSGLFTRRMPPRTLSYISNSSEEGGSDEGSARSVGWFSFGSSLSMSTAASSFSAKSVASSVGLKRKSSILAIVNEHARPRHSCQASRLTPVDIMDSPLPIPGKPTRRTLLRETVSTSLAGPADPAKNNTTRLNRTPAVVSSVLHLIQGLNEAYISATVFSVTAQTQAQADLYYAPKKPVAVVQQPLRRARARRFRRRRPGYAATKTNVKAFTSPTCCANPTHHDHVLFCPPLDLFRSCFPSSLPPTEIPFPVFPPPTPSPRTHLSYPTPDTKFAPVPALSRPPDRPLMPEHQYRNLSKLQICVPRSSPKQFAMEVEYQRSVELERQRRARLKERRLEEAAACATVVVVVPPVENNWEIPAEVIEDDAEFEAQGRRMGDAVRAGVFIDGRWHPGSIRERWRSVPNPIALRLEAARNRGFCKRAGVQDGALTSSADRIYTVAFEGRGRSQLSL